MRGIHQWLVNSPHKGPVMWKMFPFDDVVMIWDMTLKITVPGDVLEHYSPVAADAMTSYHARASVNMVLPMQHKCLLFFHEEEFQQLWSLNVQMWWKIQINGLVQDCSNSSADALEILQSWTKISIMFFLRKIMKGLHWNWRNCNLTRSQG